MSAIHVYISAIYYDVKTRYSFFAGSISRHVSRILFLRNFTYVVEFFYLHPVD